MHINKYSKQELLARISGDLRAAYPGQLQFNRATVAKIIGVSRGHISNCESDGRPLLPTVRVGRKPLIQFSDVVDFLVTQRLKAQSRRGPRTKAERMGGEGEQS